MLGQYEYEKMTLFIVSKRSIEELPFEVTEEVREAWESLAAEIDEIHAKGWSVDINSD